MTDFLSLERKHLLTSIVFKEKLKLRQWSKINDKKLQNRVTFVVNSSAYARTTGTKFEKHSPKTNCDIQRETFSIYYGSSALRGQDKYFKRSQNIYTDHKFE